jgi:hypothetical protein
VVFIFVGDMICLTKFLKPPEFLYKSFSLSAPLSLVWQAYEKPKWLGIRKTTYKKSTRERDTIAEQSSLYRF